MPATRSTFLPGLITSSLPESFLPPFPEVVKVKPELLIASATLCAVATGLPTLLMFACATLTLSSAAFFASGVAFAGKSANAFFASSNAFFISAVTGPFTVPLVL